MTKEFKMENLEENLLLDLHTKYPNTIDDNARLFVGTLGFEKGKVNKQLKLSMDVYIMEKHKSLTKQKV